MPTPRIRTASLVVLALLADACATGPAPRQDSTFAAMQARGSSAHGMGVDQDASEHRFDSTPEGGRIELQLRAAAMGPAAASQIAQIRMHLQHIAQSFRAGDFQTPMFVHDRAPGTVPGTAVMTASRARIEYRYADLPRGGELRLLSSDAEALRAIHEFLAFQRGEHHASGTVSP